MKYDFYLISIDGSRVKDGEYGANVVGKLSSSVQETVKCPKFSSQFTEEH